MVTKLTDMKSIPQVVSEMTLEEKAFLVTGNSFLTTFPIERLGIPSVRLIDGATGINYEEALTEYVYKQENNPDEAQRKVISPTITAEVLAKLPHEEDLSSEARELYEGFVNDMATRMDRVEYPGCFPTGMMLGATWNKKVVYNCGKAVAKELVAYDYDVMFGPNVNIHRDPRNGRIYEGYSEDPALAAGLGSEYVKGVQSEGVMAQVKHFAANSQETFRQFVDEKISERALREIYFPAFKACVDAGTATIMSAYNKINGSSCAMNKWLLTDVLKNEWGFDGAVSTDFGAAYDTVKTLKAWNDLIMPGKVDIAPIIEAVKTGELDEKELDACVTGVLKMIIQSNTFRNNRTIRKVDNECSNQAAYEAAVEGIVLLKNNDALPLIDKKTVSCFGKGSDLFIESGEGSTYIHTNKSTLLTEECKRYAKVEVGCISDESEAVLITVQASGKEGSDREDLNLNPGEMEMALKVIEEADKKNKKKILILNVSGPVELGELEDKCDAIVCIFFPGMQGAKALADVLFGEKVPSGKLPITFPKKMSDMPSYLFFPGTKACVWYGEDIFVGYRYYETKKIKPLYPFGYGLSYTSFEITDAKIDKTLLTLGSNDEIHVEVDVKNTGIYDASEIIQLYISDPSASIIKPVKELKAFEKVFVKSGETKKIRLTVTEKMLESFDSDYSSWCTEQGEYKILIGNSSDNISCELTFFADGKSPYNYTKRSPLIAILIDERTNKILHKYIEDILNWDYSRLDYSAQFDCFYPIEQIIETYYPTTGKETVLENMYDEIGEYYLRDCDRAKLRTCLKYAP